MHAMNIKSNFCSNLNKIYLLGPNVVEFSFCWFHAVVVLGLVLVYFLFKHILARWDSTQIIRIFYLIFIAQSMKLKELQSCFLQSFCGGLSYLWPQKKWRKVYGLCASWRRTLRSKSYWSHIWIFDRELAERF